MTSYGGVLRSRRAFRRLGLITALALALSLLTPVAASAQSASCARDSAWAEMRPEWATDVLGLTNAHRLTLGLSPLAPSATLATAAGWKAAHMANYGYFSHDDPDNPTRTWDQRIRDCGYPYGAGENIAYGYRSPQEVLQGWLDSPGHRRNIENADYRVLGVGVAVADNGRVYWVQNFGMRVDGTATQPAPTPTEEPVEEEVPNPAAPSDPDGATPDSVWAPVAKNDDVTVEEDGDVRLDPIANDFVGRGGLLEIVYHEDPDHGTITKDDGGLVYRPDPDFSGTDSFHYWISDQFDRTCGAVINITVEPVNDAPKARSDAARARPRRTVFVRVTGNDSDVDGDRIVFDGIERMPRFGSATVNGDGVISYRARRGTKGRNDTITYLVSDGNGGIALGVLRIRIRR